MKPERIRAYALFKKLNEWPKTIDNFVMASNDTNEISVSFNEKSDCKVFTFKKVFDNNVSQNEIFDSLEKGTVQDVIMGLNSFLVVCRLSAPSIAKSFDDKTSIFDTDFINSLTENMLRELLLYTKNDENMDSSLHASYFEVHDDKIIDLLKNCNQSKDIKFFEITDLNCIEIKDLVEMPLVDESDISELLSKQSHSLMCYASCSYSILSVSLIKKNINSDGFEFIKVGKLIMFSFAKCMDANKNYEDWLQKCAENHEFPTFSSGPKCKILDILKPAFGGNAKTSIVVTPSSVLHSLEKDLNTLQFVSDAQKILNYPEIDLKLIIPISLKEYSEEIQELQKDLNVISKSTGVELDCLTYRSYKNSISLEKEKVKTLNNYLLSLQDAINAKKQSVINFHGITEATECEIKKVEKDGENLYMEIDKMKNDYNIKQKVSMKSDEILAMKQVKISNELDIKKLKSELTKNLRNYEELRKSLHCLKGDVVSLSCDMGAEQTSLRSTLELLLVDMNSTLSDFQSLQGDLLTKLDNLAEIDVLLKMWKQNTENLLTKFASLVDVNDRNFHTKLKMSCSLIPLQTSQNKILEIIRNNRNEKWPVLSYYFHKVQIFCDSSFKILAEVIFQLDVIQSCYKVELNNIEAVLCASSKVFKKSVSDISTALNSYQQYFEEQEKELSYITDMVCRHHKFKKHFDEKIGDIKGSLFALKQMCLGHNDATISKWNEIQKDCLKASEKHADLSEYLSVIHKEMLRYVDNLAQQKLNALEYSPMKDKTENVESKIHQLLQIYKEMEAVIEEAFAVHKKGTDKELLEVTELINTQKGEIENYFDTYSTKIMASSKPFFDELRGIRLTFTNSKDELKNSLDSLSSSISSLAPIYNKYRTISSFILEKSERSFKIMPTIKEDKKDNIPDFDCLILDEWEVPTSTPNIAEKNTLNLSYEKQKLLCRIKSMVEHQISQKLEMCDLDSEGKEKKNHNISTMSLPNLNTHSKVYSMMGKNLSKLKLPKKNV